VEVRSVASIRESLQAKAACDAAINMVLKDVLANPEKYLRYQVVQGRFEEDPVAVEVVPVAGLVNLNLATVEMLEALFTHAGERPPEEARSIAQRILDWRDKDDLVRVGGAENEQYIQAASPYLARGGPFEAEEDLLQVLGVDYALYGKVRDLVTTDYGYGGKVSLLGAPPAVLKALLGADVAAAADYFAAQASGASPELPPKFAVYFASPSAGSFYRLTARVRSPSGQLWGRRVSVNTSSGNIGKYWNYMREYPMFGEQAKEVSAELVPAE
jgi:general secretion pathway protein K